MGRDLDPRSLCGHEDGAAAQPDTQIPGRSTHELDDVVGLFSPRVGITKQWGRAFASAVARLLFVFKSRRDSNQPRP